LTRGWRIGLGIVAALVAFDLVLQFIGTLTGGTPGGPESSSYATGSTGAGALAELLGTQHHPVTRLRTTPHETPIDVRSTVFLLDAPSVTRVDALALRRFVENGGRLVVGGALRGSITSLLARPPGPSTRGVRHARPLVRSRELAGIRDVRTAALRAWARPGAAAPLLGAQGKIELAAAVLGKGTVFLLADASALQNRLLGASDNAALGLALAGPPGRPVAFLETYHGYGRSSGLAALPLAWKLLLAGLALAALTYMVARGRRLGPPESRQRDLPPARQQYVESIATIIARSKRPDEAVAPVRRHAREALLQRSGLPPDADDVAVLAAARRLGVPDDEARALVEPARGDADVLAVGRALARLGQDLPR
jgi:hypothetical protein